MDKPDSSKTKKKAKSKVSWIALVTPLTFVISVFLSFVTKGLSETLDIGYAILILLFIIGTGILFDIVGVAVTAADETPFHALAAKKKKGARAAIHLIRNAEKVSSFCNDVVGDIAGIISGSTSGVIVAYLVVTMKSKTDLIIGTLITALVAALTVGGKACGKTFAINQSYRIIRTTANFLSWFGFGKR